MLVRKHTHLLGAAIILAGTPLTAALAQSAPPPTTNTPPASSRPESPAMPPAANPSDTMTKPATPPRSTDKSATTAPAKVNPLVGLAVFSSDGTKLGAVQSVSAEPDGKVKAIHIKTGGFLGFGGKVVAIPDGKFTRSGENIQLGLTTDEVSKLPEVKGQS